MCANAMCWSVCHFSIFAKTSCPMPLLLTLSPFDQSLGLHMQISAPFCFDCGRMARRSNQNSIRSSPSIRSKSDGAGPGVRSTVMYGAFGRTRSRVSLFKFLSMLEWFVRVVLMSYFFNAHVESATQVSRCAKRRSWMKQKKRGGK